MTAHLRLAHGIEPIGACMGNLAALWSQLTAAGLPLDDLYGVDLRPEQGGTITAYFTDEKSLLIWADHLGLAFRRDHIAGRTYLLIATGHITRGTRSAVVQLRCAITDRSAS